MWLWLPISVSSQGSEDSTSPCDSLFQRLTASAMWRSKFQRSASWRRAWKMVPWMRRLCGLTFDPSLQNFIVAEWLEQFSVSPARISLSQESKRALRTAPEADSSMTPCGSFARLDANGVFLRTSPQFSLFQQDTPFSENLPKAGSMWNGFLFAQPTLELRTDASEYSSWPTARAEDSECCGNHPGAQDSLTGASRARGTPRVTTNNGIGCPERTGNGSRLEDQAEKFWNTPHGMAGVDASGKHGGAGGGEFAKQANRWPTPDANAMNDGEDPAVWRERQMRLRETVNNGNGAGVPLAVAAAEFWTTPQAHDSGGGNPDRVRRRGTEHGCANLADDMTKWNADE